MPKKQILWRTFGVSNDQPPKLLVLPSFIVSKSEVHRLLSELLQIEDFLYKAGNRQPGSKLSLPKTTDDLDKFAEANKRNVLNHGQRIEMARFLRAVYKYAPEIGVILPSGSNSKILDGITKWFRQNIHAQTLLVRSTQNRLSGGAIIRIKHKSYDFSLNNKFTSNDNLLIRELSNHPKQTQKSDSRANYS